MTTTIDEHGRGARGGPPGAGDTAPAPRRRGRLAAAVVAVTMAALVAVMATRPSALNQVTQSPLLHKPAPPIVGQTIAGTRFDLGTLRGDWVVVNFFASWCVPCRQEHPELVDFARRHAGPGDASVVSVVFQDDTAAVRSFFAEKGGDWPVVLDPDGVVALDYGVTGVPESFLVAPDGVVAAKLIGGVDSIGLDEAIASVQAESGKKP